MEHTTKTHVPTQEPAGSRPFPSTNTYAHHPDAVTAAEKCLLHLTCLRESAGAGTGELSYTS